MRIRKYDFDYGRRALMQKAVEGVATAGVLAPLWPMISHAAEYQKAYPDELVHIEAYTRGRIKPGDLVTADNVDAVKDLLDPITLKQVQEMGRRIRIRAPIEDVTKLYPARFLEATVRNEGRAVFDNDNNIWDRDGSPWIGGLPFPNAQSGLETIANLTLSWGRQNSLFWAARDWDIGPSGNIEYQYDLCWTELNTTARPDGTVFRNRTDLLRLNTIFFTSPRAQAGSSFLSIWHYDQRQFPELLGWFPAFKRIRQFPTNQRFEPLVPGNTLFLSDAWHAGDPMLTWGNYKIVGRQPMLAAISGNWAGDNPNWEKPVHGGAHGNTFYEHEMELVPECIVLEAEPVAFPRAPVGKKRQWIDVRNQMSIAYVTFDRSGNLWKQVDVAWSLLEKGNLSVQQHGVPAWSWTTIHIHDIQDNRMSRFNQTETTTGGFRTSYEMDEDALYNEFLTPQALRRLGA